jgi:hemerythrin-like domain-containing protein
MKPIGPLMIEHRTIEKMVKLISVELRHIGETGKTDPLFIAAAVDFFRTYADRTHHGKEEDILFKELEKKELAPELQRVMNELVAEHVIARETVRVIDDALAAYTAGDHGNLKTIVDNLNKLVKLYPQHIEKEDKHFFYPMQEYFDEKEQSAMLQAFWEFDRQMIHEKYKNVVEEMKSRLATSSPG